MKLNAAPNDGVLHSYCMRCRQEAVREQKREGRVGYICRACNFVHPRALIIDPAIEWWLDQTGEYWHETAGVFVRNTKSEFLFFERVKYPFGLTVPAGHVDRGEAPLRAAHRELAEKTGLRLPMRSFQLVAFENIRGDECRRGSDAHRWNAYAVRMRTNAIVKVDTDEAARPVWLTLDRALQHELTFAVRFIIVRYAQAILRTAV